MTGLTLRILFSFILIISCLLTSCSNRDNSKSDFVDKLLDLATVTSSKEYLPQEYVELTHLYDSLTHSIPEDKDERLILVERLKERGFEVINWGRGNFPPLGPRIINVELKKENCRCEVSKIYYSTVEDNAYQMAEGINCKQDR